MGNNTVQPLPPLYRWGGYGILCKKGKMEHPDGLSLPQEPEGDMRAKGTDRWNKA